MNRGRPRLQDHHPHLFKNKPPSQYAYRLGCRCDECRAIKRDLMARSRRQGSNLHVDRLQGGPTRQLWYSGKCGDVPVAG